MSRYIVILLAVLVAASVFGCENSKLQRDMLEDSTWETSAGYEDLEAADSDAKPDEAWEEENAPMDGEAPAEEPEPKPAPEPEPESSLPADYPRVTSGEISRSELVAVLDAGLGRFLQHVETEPSFRKGSFVGFRILSMFPDEPAYASLDLRPGDTVTRINGKSIERPEQAAAVWNDLRTASNLVVDYRRGTQEHALRFTIVDAS